MRPLPFISTALLGLATCQAASADAWTDKISLLSSQVESGDSAAFRRVLALAETTPPGANLEDLAEISSHFVTINPNQFLRAQSHYKHCFGVEFMGADYVDNDTKREREVFRRRTALQSIKDPSLSSIRQICLARLGGG
jgi:hypothetical protein